jgi:hypothetical protein
MLDICILALGGGWWLVFGFGFPKTLEVLDLEWPWRCCIHQL